MPDFMRHHHKKQGVFPFLAENHTISVQNNISRIPFARTFAPEIQNNSTI